MSPYALKALSWLGVIWGLRASSPRVRLAASTAAVSLGLSSCAGHPGPAQRAEMTFLPNLVYASPAGTTLAGDLYLPAGPGPFPTILVVHGGGWKSRRRSDMKAVARRLAKAGYAAFNIDYRKAPKHLYPAAVDDCREAVRWLRAHAAEYRLDPSRFAALGYSSGAHLAALVGYERLPGDESSSVQALVLGGTPTDLRLYPKSPMVRGFLGKTFADAPELYARASPIVHVAPGGPPTFLYHGRQDWLVSVTQARALKKALDAAEVNAELYESSPATHFSAFYFDGRSIERAIRFLNRHIGAETAGRGS